jgi:hypothetical protein
MIGKLTAYPAYGRRYKNADALKYDFLMGSDFSASYVGGPYFSIRDFTENNNCIHFDGVLLSQPGTNINVSIDRREMCARVKASQRNRPTLGLVKDSSGQASQ